MESSRFIFLAVCFLILTACNKTPSSATGTPKPADPVAQLRALAAKLDKPLKEVRFTHVEVDVRKSDSLVSPLIGTITGVQLTLSKDDDPTGGRFRGEDIAYFKEFTIFADYIEGEWVYAGCKGRFRAASNFDWMSFNKDRRELLHCGEAIAAMQMKHDKDAY